MSKVLKLVISLTVIIFAAILIIMFFTGPDNTSDNAPDNEYVMKALNNTVALYKDNEIVKVYDGIVVDTLPISDRESLEKGIEFQNENAADLAAEDYDG